jgi:DNA-binding CsgD family transcriptional regulator
MTDAHFHSTRPAFQPIMYGLLVGAIHAASPVAVRWLQPATPHALCIAFIAAAWVAGRCLARVESRHHLASPAADTTSSRRVELTEREPAVLRYLPTKLTQRDIAAALYVSMNTVKTHSNAIFRKLGVSDRKSAVQAARDSVSSLRPRHAVASATRCDGRAMTNAAHRIAAIPPNRNGSRGDDTWMTQPISSAPIGVLPNSAV